jgi:hypothetical protein
MDGMRVAKVAAVRGPDWRLWVHDEAVVFQE